MMRAPENCIGLADVRKTIDWINLDTIQALGRRMGYVRATSRFRTSKVAILAPERIAVMLPERAHWVEENRLDMSFVEGLFAQIIHWYIAKQVKYWHQTRGVVRAGWCP